ncbi:arylsulfatase A-like enzyme [Bradyrhizobium sp. USDA 4524]|uniref:alkaline phosphatase family protein n=1 Tax=Bradyrhizobium TaxID=374 RepID=UPI00209F7838|nr:MULTISPECIES: alkaline phosphatase family protein [Bradyrhizobium]MCP1845100.1 arylsulfatase A-like enzyme [Bradyrhizobium sp. USDA 4538]MCP1905665.1 arylsulfatase A-like enzyme [Bradyrhizobium sp. USDA 4537]MCP1988679.1 arylsulfatase A-like enzyme [Bradyrhizobium sp. USDA 4539]MCP3418408.1 alkaline phosphatase family protein [Bradyrhizobium brasilense]
MKARSLALVSALFIILPPLASDVFAQLADASAKRRAIVFVWDGLRADDLAPEITPNYFALARTGVIFADHHAVYPTFTMMNSASIATGTYPGTHGFYGNVVYAPRASGKNAKGAEIDFSAPAFIEDFGVVEAVREAYQGRLTRVPTLLQAAQANGLTTAAVGKFGAAFIQDYLRGGIILDEDAAIPLAFAKELQNAGYALPRNSINAHPARELNLAKDNGDPTAPIPIQRLKDGQTANPLDRTGALSRPGFRYLTDVFVNYILPVKQPDLTVFWSKEPDATNHAYGPGTYNSIDATRMNDEILGRVMDKLRELGWEQSTDIIITQDHNHSTVSGDVAHFPLRDIADGGAGAVDPHGYSVSGFVRTAELLSRDGLKAYDGVGCRAIPILSGILPDGTHLQPLRDDDDGSICGKPQKLTSAAFVVPKPVPAGAVVVAANAGSDYLFVPDGNLGVVKAAVASLQSRQQFGAIFVSDRYDEIAGTLPMSLINTESKVAGRAPDVIVSFNYDGTIAVAGKPGISYASSVNRRGDHGSFSPTDTRISLLARGPDFKVGLYDTLPTANVDIAPTVAHILKLSMPDLQGRVLEEALKDGPPVTDFSVLRKTHRSSTRTGLTIKLPTDLDGRGIDPRLSTYAVELHTKVLSRGGNSYTYFDHATSIRE